MDGAKLRELTDHMPTPDDEAVSAPKVPSLIRKRLPIGPYSRNIPRAL